MCTQMQIYTHARTHVTSRTVPLQRPLIHASVFERMVRMNDRVRCCYACGQCRALICIGRSRLRVACTPAVL